MILMCPESRLAKLVLSIFALIIVFSADQFAQTKKTTTAKPVVKKTVTQTKDARKVSARNPARKDTKKSTTAKSTASNNKKKTVTTARNPKNQKAAANKKKPAPKVTAKSIKKMTPAERRAEAKRKKAEEAKRLAALAEQRRREQAAREARERKLAFERGLRTETTANIQNDVIDGEDLRIRSVAVEALGNRAGTVVVMEARTGRILTIVNQDWAITNGFKPCSTIKLVTAVAGISENLITPDGGIVGESTRMGLDDALAYSNNAYFQRVGSNLGNEKMIAYARRLGLGQPTGINVEGETGGRLPFGNNNLRIYSHADDFEVTPLQLAVMVSAISNGGKRVVPFIPRTRVERANFRPNYHGEIGLPEQNIQGVLPGMIGAAEYGTARRGVDSSLGIAGKTGSCIGKGSWVGLFASVAPVEDPQYSVVVITRGEGERGKYAAAVAGKVYQALSSQIARNPEKNLALRRLRAKPEAEMIDATAFDEDEEDSGVGAADEVIPEIQQRIIIVGARPTATKSRDSQKIVTKTTQSKPVFPPVVIQYQKGNQMKQVEIKPRPRIVKNK